MPWGTSNRKAELPLDWEQRRQACIEHAGGRCQARIDDGQGWQWPSPAWIGEDSRCVQAGTDVDHKVHRDDHSVESLQLLCVFHHTWKSQRESAAGRAKARKKLRIPDEKPPGLL